MSKTILQTKQFVIETYFKISFLTTQNYKNNF
jgi:hypothetical protein